ncbi:MAG: PIN domain-containing protein [Treponema sp.]|jgi:predicted nucleic acid-binding protein|nr:PIN domain-containing protein [Treponema sp.]
MNKYALDTDIVTYYLKGNKDIINRVSTEADNSNTIVIPPMVFYEIKRWLLTINASKKLAIFEYMCSLSGICAIEKETLEIAAATYSNCQKKGIVIGDNDILIASFCIYHDITLVTNNEKHFKSIPNLKFVNWL